MEASVHFLKLLPIIAAAPISQYKVSMSLRAHSNLLKIVFA